MCEYECVCVCVCVWPTCLHANSKHWFTKPFVQPLPYLVTPQGPENCQLTSRFCWCSNSSMFVTNNSNEAKRVIYSRQQSLHQHKSIHNRLNRNGTIFLPGVDASHVYVRALALGCFCSHISTHTPSTVFRHLPPREDVVNQCLVFG